MIQLTVRVLTMLLPQDCFETREETMQASLVPFLNLIFKPGMCQTAASMAKIAFVHDVGMHVCVHTQGY